jgi:hypothetical protein
VCSRHLNFLEALANLPPSAASPFVIALQNAGIKGLSRMQSVFYCVVFPVKTSSSQISLMQRSAFPSFPLVCLAYMLDQGHSLLLPKRVMHLSFLLTVRALRKVENLHLTFVTVDKSSRPLWSVVFILMWGPLAYINIVAAGVTVCKLCHPQSDSG